MKQNPAPRCRHAARQKCLALQLVVLLLSAAAAVSQPSVSVKPITAPQPAVVLLVDGRAVEAESLHMVRGQQVMVWLRELEKLGWGTVTLGQPEHILFNARNVVLTFVKGESLALVNSLAVQLPVNTYMKGGRFMVPLSFVAKALGYKYECSYRPVCTIITSPTKAVNPGDNSVTGRVLYNGKPAEGIRVRVVDREFVSVEGARAVTDADGNYTIGGLPDGDYMVYVYVQDNPAYFNRASRLHKLSDGQTAQVEPLRLGRILSPISPKPGGTAAAASGKLSFFWTPCEGAVSYRLSVSERGASAGSKVVFEAKSTKPAAQAPAQKFAQGVIYEARVEAISASGEVIGGTAGTGGTPWTFTVGIGKIVDT